jgi:hypothetical protein
VASCTGVRRVGEGVSLTFVASGTVATCREYKALEKLYTPWLMRALKDGLAAGRDLAGRTLRSGAGGRKRLARVVPVEATRLLELRIT